MHTIEKKIMKPTISLGFGINPALLICDVTEAYTNPHEPIGFCMQKEINVINQIIKLARIHNTKLFFTTIAYSPAEIACPNLWQIKIPDLQILQLGSSKVNISSKVDYQVDQDFLIIKKYASAFFGTQLSSLLSANQIDTLIILGCTTSGCIRASTVDCIQFGFRPMVVSDGVADRCSESHQQALLEMNAKYADIIDSSTVISYLQAIYNEKITKKS